MNKEGVILVNLHDKPGGVGEKLLVHKKGILHRAFSILVFNSKNEMLLQKRALSKYHCGGLWSNACCSHPRPNESLDSATKRRLKEEMGLVCKLKEIFVFHYKVSFDNLTENEIDHVFIGYSDSKPKINKEEVSDYKWVSLEMLDMDITKNPEKYTPWFRIIWERIKRDRSITLDF
ncbi:MAG: isopentenyl-diphosphate Delta-isomerase [Candidatus Pacearchaeota archaeon]|nr:isopentenyl-diphosphate Delta-isomerase [Candidatus Pacearchaeota archaeon]